MKFEVIDQKNIGKLRKAFIEAVNGFSKPKKNGDNKYVGSSYNTLTDVFDACKEALKNNGFVISQDVETSDDGKLIKVTTYLIHELGTITFKTLSIPTGKQDAQRFGSAITYARRYSLTANLGLTAEDDDGNTASNNDYNHQNNSRNYGNQYQQQNQQYRQQVPRTIDDKQKYAINKLIAQISEKTGIDERDITHDLNAHVRYSNPVRYYEAKNAIAYLQKQLNKQGAN